MSLPTRHYIGVDVGTGSARAALLTSNGQLVASHVRDIRTWRSQKDHRIFEQSTEDIWSAICAAVRACLATSTVDKEYVKGVGMDATCSLAVVDANGKSISVSEEEGLGEEGERNIVLWADHRAEEQAEGINRTGGKPLDFVGGTMSLEMELPKMAWLKAHMPTEAFAKAHFFDLPDYLTYRATGSRVRSYCSLACKCGFVPSEGGWDATFLHSAGLGEFVEEDYARVGGQDGQVRAAGVPTGDGLSEKAAREMGLEPGTPVGSAVIDAYAGWLGTVGASTPFEATSHKPILEDSQHRLAAVAGTSTCFILSSPKGIFVPGVWGPYRDAIFPGWWMNEGGQSATGQLIEHVLTTHPAHSELLRLSEELDMDRYSVLNKHLDELKQEKGAQSFTELTAHMHFYPDLHGNRSPLADAKMHGSISGLTLATSLTSLALLFHLTLESLALQTRHILSALNEAGHTVMEIYVSGSQAKNAALMAMIADCCGVPVVIPDTPSAAVVRGAAMLGRMADEMHTSPSKSESQSAEDQAKKLWNIMVEMTPAARHVLPSAGEKEKRLLQAKYDIFLEQIEIQRRWRGKMEEAAKGS